MSGNRVYAINFENVTVAAVQDLLAAYASSSQGLELHQFQLTSNSTVDAILRVELRRLAATVTSGSAGSAFTPAKLDPYDSAANFTARINDTTKATSAGTTVLQPFEWDQRAPLDYLPAPEDRPTCKASEALVVDIVTGATVTSASVSGWMLVREF